MPSDNLTIIDNRTGEQYSVPITEERYALPTCVRLRPLTKTSAS